jgi:hypothetical protein
MLRDNVEKAKRGYVERDSVVWPDGREKLVGRDWRKRKAELWERCGGRCERHFAKPEAEPIMEMAKHSPVFAHPSYFERCKNEAHDPHHIEARSKRRWDNLENLIALCRSCHRALDPRKPRWSGKAG